jgi:hypothetical protein
MSGLKCAPVTAPKEVINNERKMKLVMPPIRGSRKAELLKLPSGVFGLTGISADERLAQVVMYTSNNEPDAD